jgi:hypothetical protein
MNMRRCIQGLGFALIIAAVLALATAPADGGRIGGPLTTKGTAPAGLSVYYDIPFVAGQPAVINLVGNGTAIMHLIVYDYDGNTFIGTGVPGTFDRRTVTINVVRSGNFRVEVRNIGVLDDAFTLTTN